MTDLQRVFPLVLFALASSCGGKDADDTAATTRGDCNTVNGGSHCLLPFPSSFFLREDAGTVTGYRVDYGSTSLPINEQDLRVDPTCWNEKDGFSTVGTLYLDFPGVRLEGTAGVASIGDSLDEASRTVILDAETGERVPHWVELHDLTPDPDRKPLMLRPAVPLAHARRYVVGIRGLVDASGVMAAPSGFRELRDGTPGDASVEWQRAHYEDAIFPRLQDAGFARDELQMAWDFVTVSKESSLGRALHIRDDALERLPAGGPPYVIHDVVDADCSVDGTSIWRTLEGTFTSPSYLTNWAHQEGTTSLLTRDDAGMPYENGTAEIPFTIRVPCTFASDPRAGRLLQYGHGLLGDQDEVRTGYLSEMADRYGWILFGVDWTGMKSADVVQIVATINNGLNHFAMIPERIQQGYVEYMLAGRMMMGDMATDAHLTLDGVPLVDPSTLLYYGNSQGGILGGGYVAFSPDIRRAVLGVAGMPYNLLLLRSNDFDLYLNLLRWNYPDEMDVALLIGIMQQLWDPGEAGGWASYTTLEPVDDHTPTKQILIQTGIGDAQVPTLGGQLMARAYGAALVEPPARDVWGLETRQAPFEGSALVEFDFGVVEPEGCVPADEATDTHELPRREAAGQEQIRTFLETGVVENFCDGACP